MFLCCQSEHLNKLTNTRWTGHDGELMLPKWNMKQVRFYRIALAKKEAELTYIADAVDINIKHAIFGDAWWTELYIHFYI